MRILLLSDLHGHLPSPQKLQARVGQIDLLLLGGDYTPIGATRNYPEFALQKQWVETTFQAWLEEMIRVFGCRIVGIAGNHDLLAELPAGERVMRSLPWTYLRDQSVIINGAKIYGTPWSTRHPQYLPLAFQKYNDDGVNYQSIPLDVDIILSHGPPRGACDVIAAGTSVGSIKLAERVKRIQEFGGSVFVVCGHVHENAGVEGEVIGCAIVNKGYCHANDYKILDFQKRVVERVSYRGRPIASKWLIDERVARSRRQAEKCVNSRP